VATGAAKGRASLKDSAVAAGTAAVKFVLRFALAVLKGGGAIAAGYLHHYMDGPLNSMVSMPSVAEAMHDATSIAFAAIWVLLLYDIVICFIPGREI
jgi:hypothetical protein